MAATTRRPAHHRGRTEEQAKIHSFGRRGDGRLALRRPLDGLATVAAAPGLVAVVVVLVGATAFDGLSRTAAWQATVPRDVLPDTLGLAASILLIAAVYLGGTRRPDPFATGADLLGTAGRVIDDSVVGRPRSRWFSWPGSWSGTWRPSSPPTSGPPRCSRPP